MLVWFAHALMAVSLCLAGVLLADYLPHRKAEAGAVGAWDRRVNERASQPPGRFIRSTAPAATPAPQPPAINAVPSEHRAAKVPRQENMTPIDLGDKKTRALRSWISSRLIV